MRIKNPLKKQIVLKKDSSGKANISLSGFKSFRKSQWKKVLLGIVIISVGGAYIIGLASAAKAPSSLAQYNWDTPVDGFTNQEISLSVEDVTEDAPYFWAEHFNFISKGRGYIGLQSHGGIPNGEGGKVAVFSFFGAAIDATPGSCEISGKGFDGGDNSGTSCRIRFEWQKGSKYSLRMARTTVEANGAWWWGWVHDMASNKDTLIGKIKAPLEWKGLGDYSGIFTEYFGADPKTCSDLPYSKVHFYQPSRISANVQVKPTFYGNAAPNSSACQNAKVTDLGDGTRLEVGVKTTLPVDRIVPDVTIAKPKNLDSSSTKPLSLPISIEAKAKDNVSIKRLQVYLDGVLVWNTSGDSVLTTIPATKATKVANHTLKFVTTDASGNTNGRIVSIWF